MANSAPSDFFRRVWAVVAQVPRGRVTTYGHIARHIGTGQSGMAVGWALKAVASSDDPLAVPCHRVVNRNGVLVGRRHFPTPDFMAERLHAEGVAFVDDDQVDRRLRGGVPEVRSQVNLV
ncbi:MAG: MGMT family protein, partial [Bacteroidota bacterium]